MGRTADKSVKSVCIWCGSEEFVSSIEHILPDALGCPPDFILTDCVCKRCNNGLAHIDQALVKQFEIVTFIRGIKRKRGRPPTIESWSALRGRRTKNGPELVLNAGPGRADAWGKALAPAGAANGITNAKLQKQGRIGTVTFDQTFGDDPRFIRALFKVAIASVAYWHGAGFVRQDCFTAARDFVLTGYGEFGVLMFPNRDTADHIFRPPVRDEALQSYVLAFTIFGVEFVVDLMAEQVGFRRMHSLLTMQGAQYWTKLPIHTA